VSDEAGSEVVTQVLVYRDIEIRPQLIRIDYGSRGEDRKNLILGNSLPTPDTDDSRLLS
jgi:hypothetical protein